MTRCNWRRMSGFHHRARLTCAVAVVLALVPLSLAGCHSYEQVDPSGETVSSGQAGSVDLSNQSDLSELAVVVEALPEEAQVSFSTDGTFSANEVLGTRIYTPYYSVLIPYGYWPEGYSYSYDPVVDEEGLGHVLTVAHPALGADAEALLIYTYDVELGFSAPLGEYTAIDLGLSQANTSQGVALAEGYARVGWDSAQADVVAFAPNVAGIDWY